MLQENADDGLICLHAKTNKRYSARDSDIPIWGSPVIYDTRQGALESLNPDDDHTDLQFVRLVLVADYDLLKRLCIKGKEVVRSPDAALYCKVAPTCPAYYALWEESLGSQPAHEVCSYFQRTWTTEQLLKTFHDVAGGIPSPTKLHLCRGIRSSDPGRMVQVKPGVSVVHRGWCDETTATGGVGEEFKEAESSIIEQGQGGIAGDSST